MYAPSKTTPSFLLKCTCITGQFGAVMESIMEKETLATVYRKWQKCQSSCVNNKIGPLHHSFLK